MPEQTQLLYDYKELAEILVKNSNIHSGHWMVFMRFGIQGTNVPCRKPDSDEEKFYPTAMVPVMELGIQKMPEPSPLSVDAAVVNPAPRQRQSKKDSARKPKRKAAQRKK